MLNGERYTKSYNARYIISQKPKIGTIWVQKQVRKQVRTETKLQRTRHER